MATKRRKSGKKSMREEAASRQVRYAVVGVPTRARLEKEITSLIH